MPDRKRDLETRFASLRLNAGREAEIIEELTGHLEQRYAELRDQGIDEPTAVALVREEMQAAPDFVECMRLLHQTNVPPPVSPGAPRRDLLAEVWRDFRLAARMLRKQRALTL
jgi:putative ABC transport system permease protein